MSDYDFENAKKEWQNIPVDDVGYINSKEMTLKTDDEIKVIVDKFIQTRYDKEGFRNFNNMWCENLTDDLFNKVVFDFGCGYGIESLKLSYNNNQVILGDINIDNINAADRILTIYNKTIVEKVLISNEEPYFKLKNKIDVFYSNGVLHHTPNIRNILLEAVNYLNEDGEIRLMLYSDIAWIKYTDSELQSDYSKPITSDPNYIKYVKSMDSVGFYADWYNREKLEYLFGDFLVLTKFAYITRTNEFCVAIFKPKKN
jgi:SAM-dependent methyltransferase